MAQAARMVTSDVRKTAGSTEDGLSCRAFLIGLGLCALLGVWLTYNRMVVQGPFMG